MAHLLLLASLLAPLASVPTLAQAGWIVLEPPRACVPPPEARAPAALLDAAHLLIDPVDVGWTREAWSLPLVDLADYVGLASGALAQRGTPVELRLFGGALFARGEPPALAGLRELGAELDAQAARFSIDVEVRLEVTGADPRTWTRRMTSGRELVFGERVSRPFVAGFEVEVAQEIGQSVARLGEARTGAWLHLSAARLDGGKRVLLDGLLDVAALAAHESFDPETPDLGELEQPSVRFVQLAFAGSVASGEELTVELSGNTSPPNHSALAGPARLVIRATAQTDVAPKERGWVLLDLAAVAADARDLAPVEAGAQLPLEERVLERSGALLAPERLAAELDLEQRSSASSSLSSSSSSGARGPLHWSPTLVLLRADDVRLAAARERLAAAETALGTTLAVEVASPSISARFPALSGRQARLVAGTERALLTGYDLEVATQSWMPRPRVERAFDGLCLELAPSAAQVDCTAWRSRTLELRLVGREAAQVGRMQLAERALEAGAGSAARGGPPLEILSGPLPLTVQIR